MKLQVLKLYQFKNHDQFDLEADHKVVGFFGLNGVGKTNVLDAIFMLSTTKSYFSSTDLQCIQQGKKEASIRAKLQGKSSFELKMVLQRGKRKLLTYNDKRYDRFADHLGKVLAVVIAPSDVGLIYGDNADRRKFIDRSLSQTDPEYLNALMQYKRLHEQRNAHLKSDRVDHSLLDSMDEQMTPHAHFIYERRSSFLAHFVPLVESNYLQLSANREHVHIDYRSQIEMADYQSLNRLSRQADLLLRRTTVGIHKDQILFQIDGEALKKFGSQGQVKSFLIALKLAQYEHYEQASQQPPLLLLDDIFEKIDDQRSLALTNIIKSGNFGQIFVTDTQEERLRNFCAAVDDDHLLIEL